MMNAIGGVRAVTAPLVTLAPLVLLLEGGNPRAAAIPMRAFELIREPVLDPTACAGVVDELLALRPHWRPGAGPFPFFLLGAAGYFDGVKAPVRYFELAATYNPLLRERFGWLLERVRQAVERRVGREAQWFPGAALPGFHIYLAHTVFALPVASIHYDLQYQVLDLTGLADVDLSQPLSFTLPISLPKAGSGLNTWEEEYDPSCDGGQDDVGNSAARVAPVRHPYHLGELVMHSGHTLHQAAPAPFASSDERRITLQGHGIRAGGRMHLYW